jgi:hypothetical protein
MPRPLAASNCRLKNGARKEIKKEKREGKQTMYYARARAFDMHRKLKHVETIKHDIKYDNSSTSSPNAYAEHWQAAPKG